MSEAASKAHKKLFHAMIEVTRLEEWCVEAETAEEARTLLASGEGHRCNLGDRVGVEITRLEDE